MAQRARTGTRAPLTARLTAPMPLSGTPPPPPRCRTPPSALVNATPRSVLYEPAFMDLLATYFVLGLTSAFIVPFGAIWATQEIGMSSQGLGWVMTINSLSAILVSTLIARWLHAHVSRRTLLWLGASAGALGNLAYAY